MKSRSGFTLVELMVVIAIIGLLSSVIITATSNSRLQANFASTIIKIKELQKAATLYTDDLSHYPQTCTVGNCNSTSDPFFNSLGDPRWRGPYYKIYDLPHAWGGQIGWSYDTDFTGDGVVDPVIVLDDDTVGTNPNENGARIPVSYLQRLDAIFDDGNLTTGNARGNAQGGPLWTTIVPGEIGIIFR